jgi:hypothetical protein
MSERDEMSERSATTSGLDFKRPSDEQIAALRSMVAADEGARLVLAVFQYRPQSEINALMHEFVEARMCTTADCGRVAELEAYIDIDDDDATAGWFPYCGSCGHALAIYPQRSLNSPSDPALVLSRLLESDREGTVRALEARGFVELAAILDFLREHAGSDYETGSFLDAVEFVRRRFLPGDPDPSNAGLGSSDAGAGS